jgi:hypothetical protein
MTHSMSIFCVIRSATALSITAAVNIRPDTRTAKRLGQDSSRPSLKPIPLCITNRRTFARLHSVRMLATPTDMSVPGERFFSGPMQLMTASMPSRAPVRPPGERTSPRTRDSRSADDSRSGERATAVTKCPWASACFTTLRPVAPVAPTTAIFISPHWHHPDEAVILGVIADRQHATAGRVALASRNTSRKNQKHSPLKRPVSSRNRNWPPLTTLCSKLLAASLFAAQGDHWVHADGTARGDVARQ